MPYESRQSFWKEAFALSGSVVPLVAGNVLLFALIGGLISLADWAFEEQTGTRLTIEIAPYEIAGAALGLLLILRTNAGYDRWWEARKLWGGIVNQSRNLAVSAIAYGPEGSSWREVFVKWVAAFPHVARCFLRGQSNSDQVDALLGPNASCQIFKSAHPPSFVALTLAQMLKQASSHGQLNQFQFIQIDKERAQLIDHVGACERILHTPLARVYSIKIRRFIALFLFTLPFALMHKLGSDWLVPVVTMLVAYPLLCLDRIGVELENPFAENHLGHLPINDISAKIERNLLGLLQDATSRQSPALPTDRDLIYKPSA